MAEKWVKWNTYLNVSETAPEEFRVNEIIIDTSDTIKYKEFL